MSTVNRLRGEHLGSRVIMAGDRNDLKVEVITSLDPTLKQLVKGYTNKKGDKILDVILTDSHDILQEPSILPPLQVDEGKEGKDSDHKGVQCLPRTNCAPLGGAVRQKITVRRFPESKIVEFGLTLVDKSWEEIEDNMDVTNMVDVFETSNKRLVDMSFPEKQVQVGPNEKQYFTEELLHLKRQRQRAYENYGRQSAKYKYLKQVFNQKLLNEAKKYRTTIEIEATKP